MYFEDLSPYSYLTGTPDPDVVNIGWLDEHHDFPRGQVSEAVLQRILDLCLTPVNVTRGFHQSLLLTLEVFGYPVEHAGRNMRLGSAEIRVRGKNGRQYAAPNLIYYYIKDCGYLPPAEFLDALAAD